MIYADQFTHPSFSSFVVVEECECTFLKLFGAKQNQAESNKMFHEVEKCGFFLAKLPSLKCLLIKFD